MKKILSLLCISLLLVGCGKTMNTPKKQVEMFLTKYQTLDADVISDLDKVVAKETTFNETEKKDYKDIMKKHYQDLTYDIKSEEIDGDNATVKVEIEVTDYSRALSQADQDLQNKPEDYNDETGTYDIYKFNDHRIKLLKESTERVKYTLDLTLTKVEDKWQLDQLSDTEQKKLNGTYNY